MGEKIVLDLATPVNGNNGAALAAKPLTANTELPLSDLQTMTDPNLVCPEMPKADVHCDKKVEHHYCY